MKWIKRLGYGLMILVTLMLAALLFLREPLPVGKKGPEAEMLTNQVLESINAEAWQKLPWIKWTFFGNHHYVWNKTENMGIIKWGENKVHLNLDIVSGQVWKNGALVHGPEQEKLIAKAWSFWCNDSYWLNPIAKIKDPGTERSIVYEEGENPSLLVSYKSGGVTPGDSYLYELDNNQRPTSFKMWVSILPICGLKATFEDWQQLDGGSWVAPNHKIGPFNVAISDIVTGETFAELGYEKDPFLFANE